MKHLFLFDLSHFIIDEFKDHKTLIVFIVLGLVAGLVAQLIIPGKGHGLIATAIIGIAGCYLGHLLIIDHITFIDNGVFKDLVGAIAGAALIQASVALVISANPKKKEKRT